MGLGPVPESFDAACRFLDEYEDRNLGPSPEGAALLAAPPSRHWKTAYLPRSAAFARSFWP